MERSGKNELSNPPTHGRLRGFVTAGIRLCVTAVSVCGILTLTAADIWICDLLANLRLQLLTAGAVLVLVTGLARQWKACAVQALLIVMHLSWIIDPVRRAETTAEAPQFSVTAVNVYINNHEYERIATMLREVESDVVMVTELTPSLHQYLSQALAESHPHVAARPRRDAFGVAIYSRHPLTDTRLIGMSRAGTTLLATVENGHQRYRVAAVHPVSPMTPARFELRNEHLRELSRLVRLSERDHPEIPVVAMGDFNLTPWSPHLLSFQRSSGLHYATTGSGIRPTWYARGLRAFPMGLVLDHCFLSGNLRCVSHQIGPSVASDHLPVTVRLTPATETESIKSALLPTKTRRGHGNRSAAQTVATQQDRSW